jgi:hypothetical protein
MGLWLADVLWYRGPANKFFKHERFYTAELLCEETYFSIMNKNKIKKIAYDIFV